MFSRRSWTTTEVGLLAASTHKRRRRNPQDKFRIIRYSTGRARGRRRGQLVNYAESRTSEESLTDSQGLIHSKHVLLSVRAADSAVCLWEVWLGCDYSWRWSVLVWSCISRQGCKDYDEKEVLLQSVSWNWILGSKESILLYQQQNQAYIPKVVQLQSDKFSDPWRVTSAWILHGCPSHFHVHR